MRKIFIVTMAVFLLVMVVAGPVLAGHPQFTTIKYQLGVGAKEYDLGEGKNYTPIGAVAVWVDNDAAPNKLFIRYRTEGGWMLTDTHLGVASGISGDDISAALAKIPTIPGLMDQQPFPSGYYGASMTHNPMVAMYTHEIPLGSPYFNVQSGDWLLIAAHAACQNGDESGSAWARGSGYNPGVPIPELPALVLLGVGLLSIAGFIVIRRTQASVVK